MKKIILIALSLFGIPLLSGCSISVVDNGINNNIELENIIDTGDKSDSENIIEIENIIEEEFSLTMEDFFKKGGEMTCDISSNKESSSMIGKLYIFDKSMRTNAEVTMGGQTIEINVLIKDNYSYTWNNKESQGIKFPYLDEEGTDSDSKISFKCIKKVEDKGVFDLPENIEFSETSKIDMPF